MKIIEKIKIAKEIFIDYGLLLLIIMLFKNTQIVGILFLLMILIVPFISKRLSQNIFLNLFLNLIIYYTATFFFKVTMDTNSSYNFLIMIFVMFVLIIINISQIIVIVYNAYKYNIIPLPNLEGKNIVITTLVRVINFIDIVIARLSKALPFIYYLLVMWLVIFSYASIYNDFNKYYSERNIEYGLYTDMEKLIDDNDSGIDTKIVLDIYKNFPTTKGHARIPILNLNNIDIDEIKEIELLSKNNLSNILMISLSEYHYFSSTTFFTVGYGDIEIRGNVLKIVVQTQMIIASFINVIFIAIILFIVTDYISIKKNRESLNINI